MAPQLPADQREMPIRHRLDRLKNQAHHHSNQQEMPMHHHLAHHLSRWGIHQAASCRLLDSLLVPI
jgi:hypothetical protein